MNVINVHGVKVKIMGKIVTRNTLSYLELLINRYCCIYLVSYKIEVSQTSVLYGLEYLLLISLSFCFKVVIFVSWKAPVHTQRDLFRLVSNPVNILGERNAQTCVNICVSLFGIEKVDPACMQPSN